MAHYRKLQGGVVRVWLDDEDDAVVVSRNVGGSWELARDTPATRVPLFGQYDSIRQAMEGALRELEELPSDIDAVAQDLGVTNADGPPDLE